MCREASITSYSENPVGASLLSRLYGVHEDCPIRSFRPHSNGFLFPCAKMRALKDPQKCSCRPPPSYLDKVGPVNDAYGGAFFIRFVFDKDYLDFGDDTDPYFAFRDTVRKSQYQNLPQLEASLISELNLSLQLPNVRPFCGKENFSNPLLSAKNIGRMENYTHINADNKTIDQLPGQILRIDEVEDFVVVGIEEEDWVDVTV